MTTRKRYSKEFMLDAVSLILEQEYSRTEAARRGSHRTSTRIYKPASVSEGQVRYRSEADAVSGKMSLACIIHEDSASSGDIAKQVAHCLIR